MNDLIPWIFSLMSSVWVLITGSWIMSWALLITIMGFVLDIYFKKEE